MDEDVGKQNAQGGKLADLGKRKETAEGQKCKADRGGQHGQESQGPDLSGCVQSARFMGTVQKQKVGDAVIHGKGDDRAPESDGHQRNCRMQQGIDKERQHGSCDGRQQRQQPDQRPGKSDQQQQDNGDGGENDRPFCTPFCADFVIQRGPIGADGGQRDASSDSGFCCSSRSIPSMRAVTFREKAVSTPDIRGSAMISRCFRSADISYPL